ncbi:hypothetical protein JYT26_00765 [Beggiatoa alba]|nr:hypothetical protein [Beggiatoa alba]
MDLKDFITETLVQIVSGVSDAKEQVSLLGGKVSPKIRCSSTHAAQHGFLSTEEGAAQLVQFDVALTATEGSGKKGGIGIVSSIISLGGSAESNTENTSDQSC